MTQAGPPLSKLAPFALLALSLAGCALFASPGAAPPSLFTLAPRSERDLPRDLPTQTLEIAPPGARPGFDGSRMAYVTRPYEIQYFARHQWVESPAQMLAPLLGEAITRNGRFQAIRGAESGAPALRLETEIVALQQEFTENPSRVRFALEARLLDGGERRLLAMAAFEAVEPSPSEDPYGGVIAANQAVARVLEQVAKWCAENGTGRSGASSTRDAGENGRAR
jgi:cholesterol transport system auxiliary component